MWQYGTWKEAAYFDVRHTNDKKIYRTYYDKLSRPNGYHEGDVVQVYRPIPPPGTYRKFYHPWSRDPSRVVKVPSPTNYLVRNAQLGAQPVTAHHNKIRPYKEALLVG
ncbi:hypothetical protein TSMEX_009089 [Taenia solium]|eukprot:TsM_001061500 transcript=TsM_001061500 gene=TsM_001061500